MASLSSEDAAVMIALTAEAIAANGYEPGSKASNPNDLAGRILCFIFDLSKPPAYRAGMEATREDYAGLADDPDLRHEFQRQVESLAAEGLLRSLDVAIEEQVWRGLGRATAVEAGA